MTDTVMVAVSDSPAAFDAAEAAIELAARLGAPVHALTVLGTGAITGDLDGPEHLNLVREQAATAALRHVSALCSAAGVPCIEARRAGNVAAQILDHAREIGATVIVMACVDRPGHMLPYVGSQTLRVLEFATVPVLVVPVRRGSRHYPHGAT